MTDASSAPSDGALRLLVLTGTTASGKTAVSLPLAEALQGEIVSADSRQVYRELEIGTAKPTAAERARVRHHFIDERSIHDPWSAGDYAREARARIEDILERGRTAIVVGGSMLYLRALLDGFYSANESPTDYADLRAELAVRGELALHAELQQCDPLLAARTHPHDHHRLLRGLAVFRRTGAPLSSLQLRSTEPLRHAFAIFFLYGDREQTYERVNLRAVRMIRDGLVEEVRALYNTGLNEHNCHALATHGYRELFPYLRGEQTEAELIANVQKAVRHYVKRQLTWFRREPRVIWIERAFDEPDEHVAARILARFRAS
ncbi:tRNA (adenosine(37)-N6)-dimethylallyltransferase MiaA [candidate division KSB1 bacterium]|nr:tRNA (adenosine(37)-N6)-dimethylallyltransferase MiaA [candidate division KSB1 bacterium]